MTYATSKQSLIGVKLVFGDPEQIKAAHYIHSYDATIDARNGKHGENCDGGDYLLPCSCFDGLDEDAVEEAYRESTIWRGYL